MRDVWQQPTGLVYTHSYPTGVTRIDRFYARKELFDRKIAAETGDGLHRSPGCTLRMAVDMPIIYRDRGMWKLNTSLLDDAESKAKLGRPWEQWARQTVIPGINHWSRLVKRKSNASTPRREPSGGESTGSWKSSLCMYLRCPAR